METNEAYACKHFSLALPAGENQENVPMLLEYLAKNLRDGKILSDNIMDIIFRDESDEYGNPYPSFTIYYSQEE